MAVPAEFPQFSIVIAVSLVVIRLFCGLIRHAFRTRTWFIISLQCFLAAMVFLQVLSANEPGIARIGVGPAGGTNAPAAAAPGVALPAPAQTNARSTQPMR